MDTVCNNYNIFGYRKRLSIQQITCTD